MSIVESGTIVLAFSKADVGAVAVGLSKSRMHTAKGEEIRDALTSALLIFASGTTSELQLKLLDVG